MTSTSDIAAKKELKNSDREPREPLNAKKARSAQPVVPPVPAASGSQPATSGSGSDTVSSFW